MKNRLLLLSTILFTSLLSFGQVPTSGLTNEYTFSAGALTDSKGSDDLTQTGTAMTQTSDRNSDANEAIILNGDYLQGGFSNQGDHAISFWVKTSTNNATKTTIIDQSQRTADAEVSTEVGWYSYLQNGKIGVAGNFGWAYTWGSGGTQVPQSGTSGWYNVLGNNVIADGEWHHVVIQINVTILTSSTQVASYGYLIYVDGTLDNSGGYTQYVNGGTTANSGRQANLQEAIIKMTVANDKGANLSNRYADGFDEFRHYNRLLTADEIVALSLDGVCTYPFEIEVSNVLTSSAQVAWTTNGLPTSWDVSYVESGGVADNGTITTGITDTSYVMSALQPGVGYDVYVRSICNGSPTDWSSAVSFTTKSVIYVDADAIGNDDGSSWTDAFSDLSSALTVATANNEVWVAEGTYLPEGAVRTSTFTIPTGAKIYGGFSGTETERADRDHLANVTILSGDLNGDDNASILPTETTRSDNAYHVISLRGNISGIIIDGFTITGGNANGVLSNNCGTAAASQYAHERGAAIYANPYVGNSVVSAKISNCIIEKHTGTVVSVYSPFTPCGVTGLTTNVDFENSIIRNNYAESNASFLYAGSSGYNIFSKGSLIGCLLYDNTSNSASAVLNLSASTSNGGGTAGLDVDIVNSTFSNNTGLNGNVISMVNAGNTTMANSIVYGNGSVTPFLITGTATVVSNSIVEGGQASGTDTDPLFADAANDDFSLDCSSPAISAGDATGLELPALDVVGKTRLNETLDLGAIEFNSVVHTAITAVTQDITVALDATGNAIITAADVDGGSGTVCGVDFSLSIDISSFDCSNLGANTVTLTATETGGAISNATATVTVVDNEGPSVVTQDITVQLDELGSVTIATSDIDNGSSDNCSASGNLTLSLDKTSFTCDDLGEQTVTLTVEDENGNQSNATATVTIQDTTVPVAIAQDVTVQIDALTGTATVSADDVDNGSSDNCSTLTKSLSQVSFSCADVGTHTVTLTVEDASGNQATADATVTVTSGINDETVTATDASVCPDGSSTTITTGSSVTGINYYLRNSADDAVIDGPIAGTGEALIFNTGSINESTTFNVYAETTLADNYVLDFDGVDDYVTAPISSSFDYSNGYTMEAWVKAPLPGTTGGYLPVFFLGTSSVSDVEVYIQQSTNQVVVVYNRGKASGLGGYNFTIPPNNEWFHLAVTYDGASTRVYFDGVEQPISANTSPGAVGKSVGAELNLGYISNTAFSSSWGSKNLFGKIDDVRIWNTARSEADILAQKDECLSGAESGLVAFYKMDDSDGLTAIDEVGGNDCTLTNMDAASDWVTSTHVTCGQVCGIEMTTEVTLGLDVTIPTAVTQAITVQLDDTGNATISASDVDNGSSDDCTATGSLQLSLDRTAFTCADLGQNTVTLTVTDGSGNQATSEATVTVTEATLPTVATQDVTLQLDANGNASITAAEVDNGSADNCTSLVNLVMGLDKTDFGCADLGANTVTLTVEDASGNQNTATATITVIDDLAPTAVTQDLTLQLDATGNVSLTAGEVDNGSSDNCTPASSLILSIGTTSFDCSSLGANTVTLTVEDESGNQGTANATITVVDQIVPTVVTQDITVNLGSSGSISINPSDINNGSSDNCTAVGDLILSLDISSFTSANVGANTVTLTVQDASGNSATGQATVTVIDKTPQTISFTAIADKTYGDAEVTLEATSDSDLPVSFSVISGPATITGSTLTITGAGDVTVEASQAGDDTYAQAAEQQTFTVNQASLTVTADDQTISYGGALPEFTYTFAGFVNGDDDSAIDAFPTASTTATNTSDAGSYDITLSGGSDDNYLMSLVAGMLTIVPADQTITFDAIADVDIASVTTVNLSATASSGLDVTFTLSAGDGSISGSTLTVNATGSFTVIASQGGNANYNAATAVSQSFIVTDSRKQDQTITFNSISDQEYGDAVTLGATASSSLGVSYELIGGEGTIQEGVLTILGVGSYTVRATQSGDESFNPATSVDQSFTVSKATLTYTADDQTISEGVDIPTLTYTVAGFKLSDDESVVDVAPAITTTATSSSPAATYPITLSGGSDAHYELNFVDGTLTIEAVLGFDRHADVFVYPIPSEGLVTVESKKAGGTIEIYDLKGVRIKTFVSAGNKLEMDMRDLSNGQYLIKYYIDDETTTTRLLIER